jgi:hypothetical protein
MRAMRRLTRAESSFGPVVIGIVARLLLLLEGSRVAASGALDRLVSAVIRSSCMSRRIAGGSSGAGVDSAGSMASAVRGRVAGYA